MYLDKCRIRYEEFVDSYLIGTTKTFRPYVLNGTAANILRLVNMGFSTEEITSAYEKRHGKTNAELVQNYIEQLKNECIIVDKKPCYQSVVFDRNKIGVDDYYLSVPDRVQLEIIKNCNLCCKHCYVPGTEATANMMTFEKIKRIIDLLDEIGVFVIQISGGEPLLHPDIEKIVDYIFSKNMAIQLFTNATLLNQHMNKAFVDKIMEFIISVDGNQAFHDCFRGKTGAYDSTIINVKRVLELGANVKISYSLVEENKEYLQETSDLFYGLGVNSFVCSVPAPVGNAHDFKYTIQKYKELISFTKQYYNENKKKSLNAPENLIPTEKLPTEFTCSAGKSLIYINTDYNVYPCPFFSVEKFRMFNIFDIVGVNDFIEKWKTSEILKQFRKIRMTTTKGCKNCTECGIWCRAIMYNIMGKLDGVPLYCEMNTENADEHYL